jgi:alpha-ketoglutarate-dependent taurine dioxygenase
VAAVSFADNTKETGLRPYLQIQWTTLKNVDSATYTSSLFDVEWLERFRYDDSARAHRREKTEIQPIHAIRRSGPPLRYGIQSNDGIENQGLVHVNYQTLINSDGEVSKDELLNLLDAVFRDGAAIVSNTPKPSHLESDEENNFPVAHVAKAMSGSLSHGALYGNIFHVREGEANSKNVAYTSVALCPHQDLAYYESPPGIQLLHCVGMGKGVIGGESTLIDAMAAAYQLRKLRPESFECLVKCPATFVKQRDGACMTYKSSHIVLAEEGYSKDNSTSIEREIVAVHWSPPFEGPILLPPDDVDRYYQAYADFEQMIDNSLKSTDNSEDLCEYANEYTWERKLSPGEILVFNNRRWVVSNA